MLVTRKVAVYVVHGARAFAQHVETETQMRLAATLRAGLAEGIFNGLPASTNCRASSCNGAQCVAATTVLAPSLRTGRVADRCLPRVWQVFFDSA